MYKAMKDHELEKGEKIIEGKTKIVYALKDHPSLCYVQSKDNITAWNGLMKNEIKGKAEISTATTSAIFKILETSGISTSFHSPVEDNESAFVAYFCDMIPIEWVVRRVATGSFLRRNIGVKEGYRFSPPKLETFFKDDANNDPQWSREVIEEKKLKVGGVLITPDLIDIMEYTTVAIFEILEKAWSTKNVSLVDMKIEFGVRKDTKEIILGDVIDNDSWRLWPNGDPRLMMDKQVYRNLIDKEVTDSHLANLKENFKWVADEAIDVSNAVCAPLTTDNGQVVVVMGSASDRDHCMKIKKICETFMVPCSLRVSSAHKGSAETLKILSSIEEEASRIPTVIVAVAGRSNGLGPVLSGNTHLPVINAPPINEKWGAEDIWSSLRLPSGLGCATVISPEAAGLSAAQIIALQSLTAWCCLRGKRLNTWKGLKLGDMKMRQEFETEEIK